jgi:hypothetical protein
MCMGHSHCESQISAAWGMAHVHVGSAVPSCPPGSTTPILTAPRSTLSALSVCNVHVLVRERDLVCFGSPLYRCSACQEARELDIREGVGRPACEMLLGPYVAPYPAAPLVAGWVVPSVGE